MKENGREGGAPSVETGRYLQGAVAVTLFCVGLIAAGWWATISRVEFERAEAVRAASQQNANLALAYEEHITRTLKGVDQVMMTLKRAAERSPQGALRHIVDAVAEDSDVSTVVGIVGSDGRLVARNRADESYRGDREYFVAHATDGTEGLRIGHPVKGRRSGEFVIPVTRRVNAPDGSFRGIVLTSMKPEYFTRFYGRANLGEKGVVTIIAMDGTGLVRRTRTRSSVGIDMRNSTVFKALQHDPQSGTIVSRGVIEGVPRLFSYRRLQEYPIVVAVGTSLDEVLAAPEARASDYRHAAMLLTSLALLFLGGYLFVSQRHRRSVLALLRSERALLASQRLAPLGSWDVRYTEGVDIEDCPVTWSEEMYRILGYTDAAPPRTSMFFSRVHPDDLERFRDAVRHGLAVSRTLDIEHRIVRPDGTVRLVHSQGAVMRAGKATEIIGTVRDITEQKALELELMREASYDALTGLPNRRLFQDRLDQAIRRAQRRGRNIALLFVDIDKFKAVNDTLGHVIGDALLQEIAGRLAACVRNEDTIARLGGDEFAVIVPELADSQDAGQIAEKMLRALEAPVLVAGHELLVTASIGIASYPADSADRDALMKNADTAMYRAKEGSPNRYQFYTREMNERALARLLMVAQLRRAVERGEFTLVYQPRYQARTRRMTGCEALLRWVRDGEEVAPPSEFVPLLEGSGLILPVGEWVVGAICAQMRAWLDAGLPAVPVACNVSARQFDDPRLPSIVGKALGAARVPGALLDMEITESTIMQRPDESEAMIARLRQLGVGIAIDDFGTGYSSLSRLKRFPITALKIDRSFIDGLPETDDASITRAIVTMAHSLHLTVVAEGVETAAQFEFLIAHACDEVQGYYFSPAVEAEALADMLAAERHPEAAAATAPG